MGSNYFGEPNLGNERGSSSSSRKGKKSNSDKPKQPQRGLGVAQLEKIRLHSQMGCTYLPSVHTPYAPNFSQEEMRLPTGYSSSPSSLSFPYSSSAISSPSYGFSGPHNIMMGMPDSERAKIRYEDSQPSSAARWHPGMSGTQHFSQPNTTKHFFNLEVEGSLNRKKKGRRDSMGSSSQNSETSDTQEIDLELRL